MNKGITFLLMFVILGAMGLVLFSHVSADKDGAPARKSDASGVAAGKTDAAGAPLTDLIRIDPPMLSLNPPGGPLPDGSPRTVRLLPDGSPGPARPATDASPDPAGAQAQTRAREDETRAGPPARQTQTQLQQQPMQAQLQPQQAQLQPQQTENASGGRSAGRATYPPSLTPWETPAARNPAAPDPAARANASQGAYAAPVVSEPAEPQRPAPAVSGTAPAPDTRPAPAATQSRADAPAAQRPPGTADTPQRAAPPQAPLAAEVPARARAGVPENTTERTRPPQPAPVRAGQSPEKPFKSAHTLKNISLTFAGNDMLLQLEADSAFPCKTFSLSGPDRLVIDLPGAWKGMKAPTVPGNRIVKKARMGLQSDSARLVLDLSSPLKNHKVEQRGNVVEILVQ
ncbi:MAG: AMIN domain-containing protein [Desulfovibrio sp.]|jgi:hypothetical protein|nr:AMIN domain-containing protein [Desulfovibrio sp.]